MVLSAKARAQQVIDRPEEAISTLQTLLSQRPNVTSTLLLLARLLVDRAGSERSESRYVDLKAAFDLCIRARDERRRWRGDSAEAAALAAEIAFNLSQPHDVLRLGLPSPEGEATEAEASHAQLVSLVALAAIASNRADLAQTLLDRIEPGPYKNLVQGWLYEHDGEVERARREYHQAYDAASEPADRHRVQIALALSGEWPLPDWDELREADPVQADELAALSEAARGLHEQAHQRLRRHIHTSRTSALLTADLLEESGDNEGAVRVLEQARSRFHDASFLVRAASLLYKVDLSRAEAMALRALAELPEGSADRRTMQRLLIQCAADAGDWVAVENQARSAIASGDDNPTTRWALIMALYNQGRFEDSWAALDRGGGPEPEDEMQARLWIDLHRRFNRTEATVLRILEFAETYQHSEQLVGEALMAIYTMGDAIALSNDTVGLLHAATFGFTERFPESSILSLVSADSAEELLSNLREKLEPGTEQFGELVQKVWSGQLPYGFLSSFVGRPYSEALVRRAAGCLPAHIEANADDETQTVRLALDQRVAIDTSALNSLSYIRRVWPDVRSGFSSLAVPRDTVMDAVAGREALSLRSTLSLGWDPKTESPRASEISEEDAHLLWERAAWIAHEILTLEIVDGLQWERLTELTDDRSGPWLAPLELAFQQGLTLYSDDIAMRSLATSMGVANFGTVSAIRALMERRQLADEDLDSLLLDLASGFVVDLPLSEENLHRLAEQESWQPGAASFQTVRPQFWTLPRVGLTRFLSMYRNATLVAPDTRTTWLLGGSSGLARALRPEAAAAAVGELLALATGVDGLWDPSSFARSVGAAREAIRTTHESGDPLPRALEMIFGSLTAVLDHAQASQALMGLTQSLDEPDRLQALRIVLQRSD